VESIPWATLLAPNSHVIRIQQSVPLRRGAFRSWRASVFRHESRHPVGYLAIWSTWQVQPAAINLYPRVGIALPVAAPAVASKLASTGHHDAGRKPRRVSPES